MEKVKKKKEKKKLDTQLSKVNPKEMRNSNVELSHFFIFGQVKTECRTFLIKNAHKEHPTCTNIERT